MSRVKLPHDFPGFRECRVGGGDARVNSGLHQRFLQLVPGDAALGQPGTDMQGEFLPAAEAACTRAREHLLLTGVTPASEYLADFLP